MIGRTLSHYRVVQALDSGGMGVVYAAEDVRLGRQVAIKLLPPELSGETASIERFQREARAASALTPTEWSTTRQAWRRGLLFCMSTSRLHGPSLTAKCTIRCRKRR